MKRRAPALSTTPPCPDKRQALRLGDPSSPCRPSSRRRAGAAGSLASQLHGNGARPRSPWRGKGGTSEWATLKRGYLAAGQRAGRPTDCPPWAAGWRRRVRAAPSPCLGEQTPQTREDVFRGASTRAGLMSRVLGPGPPISVGGPRRRAPDGNPRAVSRAIGGVANGLPPLGRGRVARPRRPLRLGEQTPQTREDVFRGASTRAGLMSRVLGPGPPISVGGPRRRAPDGNPRAVSLPTTVPRRRPRARRGTLARFIYFFVQFQP